MDPPRIRSVQQLMTIRVTTLLRPILLLLIGLLCVPCRTIGNDLFGRTTGGWRSQLCWSEIHNRITRLQTLLLHSTIMQRADWHPWTINKGEIGWCDEGRVVVWTSSTCTVGTISPFIWLASMSVRNDWFLCSLAACLPSHQLASQCGWLNYCRISVTPLSRRPQSGHTMSPCVHLFNWGLSIVPEGGWGDTPGGWPVWVKYWILCKWEWHPESTWLEVLVHLSSGGLTRRVTNLKGIKIRLKRGE